VHSARRELWISDPTWPTNPRLRGTVLVSLRFQEKKGGELVSSRPQL
jgi:hypothetical protein